MEGYGLVSGRAKYVVDIYLPGMLHLKAKLAPYASARIRRIDTSKAEALPGVVGVVTHEDVPNNRHGLYIPDQPVLVDEFVRYLGEPVAAVAAVDEKTAADAVELIEVDYEPLEAIIDPFEAMKPGAPVIHEGGNIARVDEDHETRRIRKGDVERAFKEADLVVESTYSTQIREHAPMETHASVAEIDPTGKVTVHTCSQAPHLHQMFVAGILGLPLHKVRLLGGRVGGGFGSKNDLFSDHITALLAYKTQRPVKWVWTREEECLVSSKDQAYARLRYKSAVMRDGTIIGRQVEAVHDSGAYNIFGQNAIEKMAVNCMGPYNIPTYWFDGWVVYTNKPPSAAMRGYNVADAHVGFEVHTDEIAAELGMDPLALRWRNYLKAGDIGSTHVPVKDSTIRECTVAAAEAMGWKLPDEAGIGAAKPELERPDNSYKSRGVGMCAGWQGTGATGGGDPGMAEVEILSDGNVICKTGAVEIGAGEGTTLAMMAAEVLGVQLHSITMALGDTEGTPFDLGTLGNRITYINGMAVRRAAEEARQIALEVAAGFLEAPVEDLRMENGAVTSVNDPEKRMTLAEVGGAAQFALGRPIMGRAGYKPDASPLDPETGEGSPTEQLIYACCMVEVEVDTRTGQVEVLRSVQVHDVGKAINPLFCEGQMEGGMAFGIANALLEDFYTDYPAIEPVPRGLHEYKIMTTMDMPENHQNVILEIPSDTGPFGAKSLGEYTANLHAPRS
jgi:xanthine dehydrogenase molybdenum-binding subunit